MPIVVVLDYNGVLAAREHKNPGVRNSHFMSEPNFGITFLVHGHSKSGKSWLGDTAPGPRLVIDAESGSRFTPSRKKMWDPVAGPPPAADGTWDTVIVPAIQYRTVNKAWEWLNSSAHPFKSVIIDSYSEVHQRIMDDLVGVNPLKPQDYGQLLRIGSDCIRRFRDLVQHPTRPLDAVVLIAMTKLGSDDIWRPHISGQLATTAPYLVDAECFMAKVPNEDGTVTYRLFMGTVPGFETGERVGGKMGTYMDDPSIAVLVDKVRSGHISAPDGAQESLFSNGNGNGKETA